MMSVPGVSLISAATFVAVAGDIGRFYGCAMVLARGHLAGRWITEIVAPFKRRRSLAAMQGAPCAT